MPITIVTGKEIEKIKGDFESYLNGLNMVGEISYSQYSELYDEGTKQIQRAYELGKSELESEKGCETCTKFDEVKLTKAKELIEDVYDKIPSSHSDYYKDVMERARQFINEVENDIKDKNDNC